MIKTKYGQFKIFDGIVLFIYKKGIKIDLNTAIGLVKMRQELTDKKTYPCLIDTNGVATIDKAARDYLGSETGQEGISAAAILCNSTYANLLARLFLNFTAHTRIIPVRVFKDENKARQWLSRFKISPE